MALTIKGFIKNSLQDFYVRLKSKFLSKNGGSLNDGAILSFSSNEGGWYLKTDVNEPSFNIYHSSQGPSGQQDKYTSYSLGKVIVGLNGDQFDQTFPAKSGTFAMTSDIPDPRELPYTITIVEQNGGYNVAYDFNMRDIEEQIHSGGTVFLIVEQDESNPTNKYLRGTFPLVEIDYDNFFLKFYAGKYKIDLEYIEDENGNVNKSNVTVYVSEPFQNKISDLSTIRSGSALGATSLQPGDVPTFHTGTSDPSSSLGNNGDIYLKISS